MGAHHFRKSDQLISVLALLAQRRQEGDDLLIRHGAGQKELHHLSRFSAREVCLRFDGFDRFPNGHGVLVPAASGVGPAA